MMQTLIALVIVAAAVSTSARPPGPTYAPPPSLGLMGHSRVRSTLMPNDRVNGYLIPRFLLPRYLAYEERAPILPPASEDDWLNKEIYRINQMDEEPPINVYEADVTHWLARDLYLKHMIEGFNNVQTPRQYSQQNIQPGFDQRYMEPDGIKKRPYDLDREDPRPTFALTPGQKGYYDVSSPTNSTGSPAVPVPLEGEEPRAAMILEPPRKTRQNPNLSRQKNLLGPDLAKLKAGLANKDYRLPVSLLPSNLRWLKINQPGDDDERLTETDDSTERPQHIHMMEATTADPADSIYGVAMVAAIGAAITMAVIGFAFGWYTLSKKAKAAADVDYPAYGVTGPTIDTSGDRKLAHSAHMYHYQHQKQQIIAMERNGMDQRTGSMSDPESEEENEEGDYTVYECPGFATTGDMEVKNPLFNEEPTPATPAKCEVVKPQPKE